MEIRKDTKKKNPTEFYGEDYLKGNTVAQMSMGGGVTAPRWENNIAFKNSAKMVSEVMKLHSLESCVDVGCGRGWFVYNLRLNGIVADGCEYGKYAVEQSVCEAKFGDLTERLPYYDEEYDLATCKGVLSHIPKDYMLNALQELNRVCKKMLMTNILIKEDKDQWYHITIEKPEWWLPLFSEAGFVLDSDETARIKKVYNRNAEEQWFAIWRKNV